MKVLITGANGFLGSNITKAFISRGDAVYAFSRNNTELKDLRHKNFRFDCMQMNSVSLLEQRILNFCPDVAIHAAWAGCSANKETENMAQMENVSNSLKLLEILQKLENVNFVCMGSTVEYGIYKSSHIWKETDKEVPQSWYGISKYFFKVSSEKFCKENDLNWLWVRPCYVYGENDVRSRLIPKVIKSCLENSHLTLNSCNSMVDYLYIEDFVDGLINLIDHRCRGVYNISSGEQYSVKNIVRLIQRFSDREDNIMFDSRLDRSGFPTYICTSNKKIFADTGWEPKNTLMDGLTKTIGAFKEQATKSCGCGKSFSCG